MLHPHIRNTKELLNTSYVFKANCIAKDNIGLR